MGTEHFGQAVGHFELFAERVSFVDFFWIILRGVFFEVFEPGFCIGLKGFDFICKSVECVDEFVG